MGQNSTEAAQTLANWLNGSRLTVAFTGAGISTESGIADFRSPEGLWSRHQPVLYQDFLNDVEERKRYWRIRQESGTQFLTAVPNAGHRALAKLEQLGKLTAVITQNIDELHQRAGTRRVLEIHGTALKVHCLDCDQQYPAPLIQERLDAGEEDPRCETCGGILKSMTVSFGQTLPSDVWMEAAQLARDCELFVALGSSLVVHPAAALPEIAVRHGAQLVIVNRDPTPLDGVAALVIHDGIGETLERVMTAMTQT